MHCKQCKAQFAYEYRIRNPETEKRRKDVWRDKNIDRLREKEHKYNVSTTRRIKQKEHNYKWRVNNPEKYKKHCREGYLRYRAKQKEVNENYTVDDERYTYNLFNNQCANCGSTDKLCVDHHYPLFKGNALTRKNAVILCNYCNCSKGCKDPEAFYTPEKLQVIEEKLKSSQTCL